jgi:hypothetical protein
MIHDVLDREIGDGGARQAEVAASEHSAWRTIEPLSWPGLFQSRQQ